MHRVGCYLLCLPAVRLIRHTHNAPAPFSSLHRRSMGTALPCAVIPPAFVVYTDGNPRVTTEWAMSLITCQFSAFWQGYCPS